MFKGWQALGYVLNPVNEITGKVLDTNAPSFRFNIQIQALATGPDAGETEDGESLKRPETPVFEVDLAAAHCNSNSCALHDLH